MTKKLEDLFELPENNDRGITISLPETMEEITTDTAEALDKIEAALPQVRGLEASDTEMDDLARLATDSYKDLMDLGMQVDARYSTRIFEVAGNMLNAAITAKSNKIDKKLKMVDLQLKKLAIDKKNGKGDEIEGEGFILTDRNSILEKLKNLGK